MTEKAVKKNPRWLLEKAHHEAGHGVFRCWFGWPFDSLDILDSPGKGGLCQGDRLYGGDEIEFHREMVESWAGMLAQKKFNPQRGQTELEDHAHSDLYHIGCLADSAVGPQKAMEMMEKCESLTRQALDDDDNWKQVTLLAQELCKKTRMTGDEVKKFMRRNDPGFVERCRRICELVPADVDPEALKPPPWFTPE